MPFSKKNTQSNKSYKIDYKVTVMMFFNIVITVHKYEESNLNFNIFLNCCQLGNCDISLARPFHMFL